MLATDACPICVHPFAVLPKPLQLLTWSSVYHMHALPSRSCLTPSWGGTGCCGGMGRAQWAEGPPADRGQAQGGEGPEGVGAGPQWCRQDHPPQGHLWSGHLALFTYVTFVFDDTMSSLLVGSLLCMLLGSCLVGVQCGSPALLSSPWFSIPCTPRAPLTYPSCICPPPPIIRTSCITPRVSLTACSLPCFRCLASMSRPVAAQGILTSPLLSPSQMAASNVVVA